MCGFTAACQIVILSREENDLAWYTIMLQSAKPLLTLFDRDPEIHVGMHNKRRRFHVSYIFQRGGVPIGFKAIKDIATEVLGVSVRTIACTVIADEIRNASECDSSFKASRVADDPVRHESAVAPAGDTEAFGIDPRILSQHCLHAIHDVCV